MTLKYRSDHPGLTLEEARIVADALLRSSDFAGFLSEEALLAFLFFETQ